MPLTSRREFLAAGTFAALGMCQLAPKLFAAPARRPRILLRNSWQIVNIGDIAHTPGVLALLEKYLPEAEVRLWSGGDMTPEVASLLTGRFPGLQIVKGSLGEQPGQASSPELQDAVDWSDFYLHGSAASFSSRADTTRYVQQTGKPFGVYGITYSSISAERRKLLSSAKFVFFRETVSLAAARAQGIKSPIMQFAPDGAFATDLENDAAADALLAALDLEPGKFVCCIPRLRYTPYWLIRNQAKNEERAARNEEMREHDHAILREAIAAVLNETDLKVLLCPEDMTQMAVGREMIYDKLSDGQRQRVVWKPDYWLTDEAISTYKRSAGLFGLEMHSPIMCIGHGVPALVGRFSEQTSKGYMWRDIGLGDWLFDFDNRAETVQLIPTLLRMINEPDWARERVRLAQQVVTDRQQKTMQIVREQLGL